MDERYDFRAIEARWQRRWEDEQTYRAHDGLDRPKSYILEMFPYPSGSGLHVGHVKNYAPNDAFCRYKSMQGFNVLHPMGWDAFGQPAENEALKEKRNPREMVPEYASNYRRTLQQIGASYDWQREINSSFPEYYKWTQWFFLLLYHRGLAYRATALINWCPTCLTGLANEEVKEGRCWRCGTPVEKRPMPQWFFRITAYADRLLADLETIHWSEGMKEMQRDWIGRSEGAEIAFPVESQEPTVNDRLALTPLSLARNERKGRGGGGEGAQHSAPSTQHSITVFTTRPDTLFGATFMVLAPEHPLVDALTTEDRRTAVDAYVRQAQQETEIERASTKRVKTGVFIGAHAINPATGEKMPIWIADYVMMGYGTGAIMGVPAHDQRDFEFARKYDIPIRMVYRTPEGPQGEAEMTEATPHGGTVVNSGPFDGLPNSAETIRKFIAWLEERGIGQGKVNFRLRDWLISRQRYWGAPIPIVHCPQCGEVPVPEDQLPVVLPPVEDYQPSGTGESPLANIAEFVHTTCPRCGGPGRRETDTMGGYACSSWYFLRFADPHNDAEFAARDEIDYWLPVDLYAGGVEHARSHLLYARFWTKVMFDAGLVGFTEPFMTLRNQGSMLALTLGRRPRYGEEVANEEEDERIVDWIILSPKERVAFPQDHPIWSLVKEWAVSKERSEERDVIQARIEREYGIVPRWARMSKSKGNVVTPDDMAEQYGADSLRLYIMSVAPFEDDVQWNEDNMAGAFRFANRAWRWMGHALPAYRSDWSAMLGQVEADPDIRRVRRKLHQTIRKVGDDIESFRFNTAVAALHEMVNELYSYAPVDAPVGGASANAVVVSEALESLVLLIAPFMPHMADEVWSRLEKSGSTYHATWPRHDARVAAVDEFTLIVQVNGKLRDRLTVPADTDDETLKQLALSSDKVVEMLDGKKVRNVVVVPRKLVNVVIG